MQIKLFTIPVLGSDVYEEEMNMFLRAHRVVDVRKELIHVGDTVYWSFCITYIMNSVSNTQTDKRDKIDYKQVLDPQQFAVFSKLRELRKQIAKEEEIPAYSVFIDAELAEFSKMEKLTMASMKKVDGIGEKRLEKFGEKLINMYEATRQSDRESSGLGQPADSLFEGV